MFIVSSFLLDAEGDLSTSQAKGPWHQVELDLSNLEADWPTHLGRNLQFGVNYSSIHFHVYIYIYRNIHTCVIYTYNCICICMYYTHIYIMYVYIYPWTRRAAWSLLGHIFVLSTTHLRGGFPQRSPHCRPRPLAEAWPAPAGSLEMGVS